MFEKAINIEPWLLAYVPDNLKIQRVCKKAVEEDTSMLKYVPDQYIMQEMCIKARDFPWLIGHVPDRFKTQEMCTGALEVCPWLLEYFSDWFATQKQIKLWCDDDYYCNDDELIKWYEDHKKQQAQKASIKEELMPNAWHPSRYWDWCVPEDETKRQKIMGINIGFFVSGDRI